MFKNNKSIPADLRSVVYAGMAQSGNSRHHQDFTKWYVKELLSEEQNRIGRALGYFKDASLLKKTLEFALSKNVRIQDTAQIFAGVWINPAGAQVAWEFTKKNWAELLHKYPSSGHILNRFIKPASVFSSAKQAKDFTQFFKTHKAPGGERAIAQVLEKVYSNAEWVKRDSEKIGHWLKKND